MQKHDKRLATVLQVALLVSGFGPGSACIAQAGQAVAAVDMPAERVSRFGEYQGCSEKRVDEWRRQSQYVRMDDGVRLAVDIVRSAMDGKAVDVTTDTGTNSRWHHCTGPDLDYPDMTANDEKSLTSTTAALEHDMTVVGYPIVNLLARSSKPDGDLYVLVEEVDASGHAWPVTEGLLRFSVRKNDPARKASWHDRSWRRHFREDLLPVVPGEWYAVDVEILPTAHLFNRGNRIRVAIMGADKDNTVLPESQEALLGVKMGGYEGSRISLPVLVAN